MWRRVQEGHAWFLPLVGLILGIVLAEKSVVAQLSPWLWGCGALLAGLLLWWSRRRSPTFASLLLFFAYLCLAMFRQGPWFPIEKPAWPQEELTLRFEVLGQCAVGEGGVRFPLRLLAWQSEGRWETSSHFLMGVSRGIHCPVKPGGLYQSIAKLRSTRSPGNPSARNWQRYYRRKGVQGTAHLKGSQWIVPLSVPSWGPWSLPQWWHRAMVSHGVSLEILGLWEAMLWGDSTHLNSSLRDLFQRTGLSHLLVVSGLHFAWLFGCCYFLFFSLGLFFPTALVRGHWRLGSLTIACLSSGVYAWMLGWTPSVARACLGMSLWVWCRWLSLGRSTHWLLTMAATLLVLWQPEMIWETGAQLSFFAVTLLLSFRSWCEERRDGSGRTCLAGSSRIARYFLRQMALCVLLVVSLFPLTRSWFPYFSWVSPIAHVLALPFVTFGLLPGLYLSLPMELLGLGKCWIQFLETATLVFLDGLRFLSRIWGGLRPVAPWKPWVWACYGLFLLLYFLGPRRWRCPRFRRQVIYVVILLSVLAWPAAPSAPALKLILIDVGQGESILLESPKGSHMLIDGGGVAWGNYDVGEKILLPELLARSITRLDVMVLTHPDADHLLGLLTLAKHIPVGEFWEAKDGSISKKLLSLRAQLESRGTSLRQLHGGQSITWDGVQVEVLSPPKPVPPHWSANNRSLVLRLCYSEVCGLLMGDLEKEGEQALLSGDIPLQSQWLKLGHHGSSSSTTKAFLEQVAPQLALASMGFKNRFGFPHPQVIRTLRARDILFLRTDRDGQIEMKIKEGEIFWRRFRDASPIPNR